ncbi:citramalyl-CoA lyase, mitochondrial-like [Liolophura sinensis]|uniref:citramalyl-CoA lyase, mitochondrial-like n=1 Tax=Liolophura sinensis TaxID=3198878 RepID=UPI003158A3BB
MDAMSLCLRRTIGPRTGCSTLLSRIFKIRTERTVHYSSGVLGQSTPEQTERFVPRRAMMYVPGSDKKKLGKIPSLQVDCAVMDCEDGVAMNRKLEARLNISEALDTLDFGQTECAVRINSVNSGFMEEDLRITLMANKLPQALMLPKVETPEELELFTEKLCTALDDRALAEKLRLVIFVESAIGIINLEPVCRRGLELSKSGPYKLDGVVFGSDDFCADIGATRSVECTEVMYARQKVVLTAKAFRLQAIDVVHTDYKDLDSLKRQSIEGARMGYTGKQVIHPGQISTVQEAFTPSPEKIEWATELIQAFDGHQKSGRGAFTFRGNMIDMPLLLQARNILELVKVTRGR